MSSLGPPTFGRPPASAAAGAGEPLLAVRGLSVSYGDALGALMDVSIDVWAGSVVAVLGNNGAGKTTLLRAISGTLPLVGGRIMAGTIEMERRPLTGRPAADVVRASIVQVPEGRQVFADMTVEDNLRAGGLARRRRDRSRRARDEVYDLFPVLRERRAQQAGLLSGGEQQMLAIGRALMAMPRLLLLDEPSLGLAPQVVDQIGDIVTRINALGTAVVLVEQNAAMALRVADRAYVLETGRVALHGDATELATSDEVRRSYLGLAARQADTTQAPPRRRVSSSGVQTLRAEGLTVRFGGLTALSDVDLEVEPGSTHALIGPNGAGKSTCLNVLSGTYRASAGRVTYGDQRLDGLRAHRIAGLGVSRTFQNVALSPDLTVADNLLVGRHRVTRAGFVASGLGLPSARRERRRQLGHVRSVAEMVGIGPHLDRLAGTLSYGDRKRVELARAVCAEPQVLLLDEPVAGMNDGESRSMAATIAALRDELGFSVVLVEHDMAFVMGLADRVTVLDFGRRIAVGEPADVQGDPEVLRAYLGSQGARQEVA